MSDWRAGPWRRVLTTAMVAALSLSAAAGTACAAESAYVVKGFRSAHFGMTEKQVRAAIRGDFPDAAGSIQTLVAPKERTTVLTLHVRHLLPGAQDAYLSYVLGYASHRLVQVSVVWPEEGPSQARGSLIETATLLRDYFLRLGLPAANEVANRQASDGTAVFFRGSDQDGHMILLTMPPEAKGKGKGAPGATRLQLIYLRDPANPDVFRLTKGSF